VATLALTTTNDLVIASGRLLVISGPDATAQKLQTAFQLVKGEWFLDTRVGVPYWDLARIKNPDEEVLRRLFRRVIKSVQGVGTIDALSLALDRATRQLSFSFRVTHDSGATITGGSGEPFIVTGAA